MSKEYLYSEIFSSIQGEGVYTGRNSLWLRYFLCSLQCDGFGQLDPTDPSTYDLPYETIDVSHYDRMEDLPVFSRGCDSSYSWAKKFKPLQYKGTPVDIADRLTDLIRNEYNPQGLFLHPKTNQPIHMVFTGGEPLMAPAQQCTSDILRYWKGIGNAPEYITFETNGTQPIRPELYETLTNKGIFSGEVFFSVSPKLWTVAGEKREKAIKPDHVAQYYQLSRAGQLKFVCNGSKEAWDEIEELVDIYRSVGVRYDIWIMPLGATVEGQRGTVTGHMDAGKISEEAQKRGYYTSARVHAYLWENVIGK